MDLSVNYPKNLFNGLKVWMMAIFIASSAVVSANGGKDDCLKLTVIPKVNGKADTESYVKLYYAGQSVVLWNSSARVKNHFILQKNRDYTVVISKAGFPDKVINISTKLPEGYDSVELYTYKMEVELPTIKKPAHITPQTTIAFNKEKNAFDDGNRVASIAAAQ